MMFRLLREAGGQGEETHPKVCKIPSPEIKGSIVNTTQEDRSKANSNEKNLSFNRFHPSCWRPEHLRTVLPQMSLITYQYGAETEKGLSN